MYFKCLEILKCLSYVVVITVGIPMDAIQKKTIEPNGLKGISENRQSLLSTDKKLASESQEAAQCLKWSKPEHKSRSVCTLYTHCLHCTCLFQEQGLQVLLLKPIKYLQVSKKTDICTKLEGGSRPRKHQQNHLVINRELQCANCHSQWSEETELLIS